MASDSIAYFCIEHQRYASDPKAFKEHQHTCIKCLFLNDHRKESRSCKISLSVTFFIKKLQNDCQLQKTAQSRQLVVKISYLWIFKLLKNVQTFFVAFQLSVLSSFGECLALFLLFFEGNSTKAWFGQLNFLIFDQTCPEDYKISTFIKGMPLILLLFSYVFTYLILRSLNKLL